MINPAPTKIQICQTLESAVAEIHTAGLTGNTPWTKSIKRALAELGWDLGYDVCTGGFKPEIDSAWLYDLIWYEENEKGFLIDVPLAVESEWKEKFSEIKFDFEKLLAARATLRLMICQCKSYYKKQRLQYFRDALTAYRHRQPGDRYLIALLDFSHEEFHFELLILTDLDSVFSRPLSAELWLGTSLSRPT